MTPLCIPPPRPPLLSPPPPRCEGPASRGPPAAPRVPPGTRRRRTRSPAARTGVLIAESSAWRMRVVGDGRSGWVGAGREGGGGRSGQEVCVCVLGRGGRACARVCRGSDSDRARGETARRHAVLATPPCHIPSCRHAVMAMPPCHIPSCRRRSANPQRRNRAQARGARTAGCRRRAASSPHHVHLDLRARARASAISNGDAPPTPPHRRFVLKSQPPGQGAPAAARPWRCPESLAPG